MSNLETAANGLIFSQVVSNASGDNEPDLNKLSGVVQEIAQLGLTDEEISAAYVDFIDYLKGL